MHTTRPLLASRTFLTLLALAFLVPGIQGSVLAAGGPTQIYLPLVTNFGLTVGGPPGDPTLGPLLIAAGDIASCTNDGDEATAALIRPLDATVLALGDNAYESGTLDEYKNCYGPSWGQFKNRTHPVPGNHDYVLTDGAGYYAYYGAAAGDPSQGYYSFDLGTWHIVALNSNCAAVGGCQVDSPQEQWLRADLAAHPAKCTLAFWHHPLFSSGKFGAWDGMRPLWQALYDAGAEIVVSGHDHDYERFAPQNPAGTVDRRRGIVQFVAGTGGKELTELLVPFPNSEVRDNTTYGVVEFRLAADSYQWSFVPVAGGVFTESGSATCH